MRERKAQSMKGNKSKIKLDSGETGLRGPSLLTRMKKLSNVEFTLNPSINCSLLAKSCALNKLVTFRHKGSVSTRIILQSKFPIFNLNRSVNIK